jgi:actin-like ATPase involved in cell morphogenesis
LLETVLKNKYGIIVGERTLKEIRRKIDKMLKAKIKISGRSCRTGRKKTLKVSLMSLK